jgi:hypothetical protein
LNEKTRAKIVSSNDFEVPNEAASSNRDGDGRKFRTDAQTSAASSSSPQTENLSPKRLRRLLTGWLKNFQTTVIKRIVIEVLSQTEKG